ncbi:CTP synthetase [Haloferax sp. Atlit-12N]|uniref:CTP synthetase n=1 Tax=Haloferax marisrubri TaxID=1544719 RepID=A0A2P4NTV2_9EURY|nr:MULTISPECIES: NAD-binding protein [Haloferax]MCO8268298.1 NAD-binding protein [Haloferax sp. AB510]POG56576.1 CTP synthetase [Haloferax marisrubri]RDZ63405.1 CTP synthetase [Haloferax sp. Atlit-12N]
MTTAIVAGTDPDGLGEALETEGATVVRVSGIASADSLGEAGIEDADLFVLTDMDDATAISVAKELNPDVRVVTYAYDSLPEFATAQADLAIDPNLLAVDVVAEELV